MDKKMYFEPEMEVVELELQGMLAASPGGTEEGYPAGKDETEGDENDF